MSDIPTHWGDMVNAAYDFIDFISDGTPPSADQAALIYADKRMDELEATISKYEVALETIAESGLEPIDPAYRRLAKDALAAVREQTT